MEWSFLVHNVSPQTRPAVATVNGVDLSASVPEVEVELSDPLNQQGSIQLHFRTPAEQAYALSTYKPGEMVTVQIGPTA